VLLLGPDDRRHSAAFFNERLHLLPVLLDRCLESLGDMRPPTRKTDQGRVPSLIFEMKSVFMVRDEPRNTKGLPETEDFEALAAVGEFVHRPFATAIVPFLDSS